MVNKQQIRKLLEYGVKINLECEKAESIFLKSVQRITRVDDTPVHRAIRESVVNMMIHSDYMNQVSIEDLEMPDIKLNKTDRQIYNYVKANEFITIEQIMAITRITTKQGVLKAVGRLEEKKLIYRDKKGKDAFYRISK